MGNLKQLVDPKRTLVRPPNYDANQDDLRPLAFQDGGMPRQAQELAAMPRQAQELAAMPRQAQELAARGRRGDTTLAHVNPLELEGIARLFPDQAITRNPDTGLPEMFNFRQALPMIAGIGSMFIPGLPAWGAALMSGATTAIAEKDLGKGVMAGLMSYGLGSLRNTGAESATKAASAAAEAAQQGAVTTTTSAAPTVAVGAADGSLLAGSDHFYRAGDAIGSAGYGSDYPGRIFQQRFDLGANPQLRGPDLAGAYSGSPGYIHQAPPGGLSDGLGGRGPINAAVVPTDGVTTPPSVTPSPADVSSNMLPPDTSKGILSKVIPEGSLAEGGPDLYDTVSDRLYGNIEKVPDGQGGYLTEEAARKAGYIDYSDVASDAMYGGIGLYGTAAPMFEEEYEYPERQERTYAPTRQIAASEYRVPQTAPPGYTPGEDDEFSYYGNRGGIVSNLPTIHARGGYNPNQFDGAASTEIFGRAIEESKNRQAPTGGQQPQGMMPQPMGQPQQPQVPRTSARDLAGLMRSYMPSANAQEGTEGETAMDKVNRNFISETAEVPLPAPDSSVRDAFVEASAMSENMDLYRAFKDNPNKLLSELDSGKEIKATGDAPGRTEIAFGQTREIGADIQSVFDENSTVSDAYTQLDERLQNLVEQISNTEGHRFQNIKDLPETFQFVLASIADNIGVSGLEAYKKLEKAIESGNLEDIKREMLTKVFKEVEGKKVEDLEFSEGLKERRDRIFNAIFDSEGLPTFNKQVGGIAGVVEEEAPIGVEEVATTGIMAGAPEVIQEGVRDEAMLTEPSDPQNAEERAIYDRAVLALEGELEPSDAQNAIDEYIGVFGARAYRALKKMVGQTRETGGMVRPANGETTVPDGGLQGEDVIAGKIVDPMTGTETANLRVGENEYIKTGKDLANQALANGLPPTPQNGAMVEGMEEEALRRAFG